MVCLLSYYLPLTDNLKGVEFLGAALRDFPIENSEIGDGFTYHPHPILLMFLVGDNGPPKRLLKQQKLLPLMKTTHSLNIGR